MSILVLEGFSRKQSEQKDPKPSLLWMDQSVEKVISMFKTPSGPLN